jgi:hypothetical protein
MLIHTIITRAYFLSCLLKESGNVTTTVIIVYVPSMINDNSELLQDVHVRHIE